LEAMMREMLRDLFARTLGDFLRSEADNIANGTSEQNLCGRLAIILERHAIEAGLTDYRADTEY
jgi:hypothetical protein